MSTKARIVAALILPAALAAAAGLVFANGGPFVIKYPSGDPAAKGVFARIDPSLKPQQETRLRVVKEDLTISYGVTEAIGDKKPWPPVANVTAAYTIENPTEKEVEVDFGFPILRGIYISPWAMMPVPEVRVHLGNADAKPNVIPTIISNSAIYGLIRQRARKTIDDGIKKDATLARLFAAVGKDAARTKQRNDLRTYLTSKKKWNSRDAALMVEYASLNLESPLAVPFRFDGMWTSDEGLRKLVYANLGPLGAIGEQKATQFFAQLASKFDPKAASTYEGIFTAWGGDVRERSVDITTGAVRPREVTIDPKTAESLLYHYASYASSDPTIYARVDYLDPNAKISDEEKAGCKEVLKNLPVVFTFAPMNLLHYTAKFPAKATQVLTVNYKQFAYMDTRQPKTYQLAYVVHPASLWKSFGPINLEVAVPKGVKFRSSVTCRSAGTQMRNVATRPWVAAEGAKTECEIYRGTLNSKRGEIFLALDAEAWDDVTTPKPPAAVQQQVGKN